jgi:Ca2+-transporting ATPase
MGEPDPGIMDRAPHAADEPILKGADFGRLGREAGLITAGAFGAGMMGAARHGLASPQANTMAFGSLVTGQLLHALTYADEGVLGRDGQGSSNPALLGIVGGSLLLQAVAMLVPGLRTLLGVAPIGSLDVAAMIAGGVLPYLGNRAIGAAARSRASLQTLPATMNRGTNDGRQTRLSPTKDAISRTDRMVVRSELSRRARDLSVSAHRNVPVPGLQR